MGSYVIKRMRHSACSEEFKELDLQKHIEMFHDIDTTTRTHYLASLERRIKALEGNI
jgi:replication fork clamp-binding protein CrfC